MAEVDPWHIKVCAACWNCTEKITRFVTKPEYIKALQLEPGLWPEQLGRSRYQWACYTCDVTWYAAPDEWEHRRFDEYNVEAMRPTGRW